MSSPGALNQIRPHRSSMHYAVPAEGRFGSNSEVVAALTLPPLWSAAGTARRLPSVRFRVNPAFRRRPTASQLVAASQTKTRTKHRPRHGRRRPAIRDFLGVNRKGVDAGHRRRDVDAAPVGRSPMPQAHASVNDWNPDQAPMPTMAATPPQATSHALPRRAAGQPLSGPGLTI